MGVKAKNPFLLKLSEKIAIVFSIKWRGKQSTVYLSEISSIKISKHSEELNLELPLHLLLWSQCELPQVPHYLVLMLS